MAGIEPVESQPQIEPPEGLQLSEEPVIPPRPTWSFPLFVDLVGNSTRSRLVLVLLFSFLSSIVTLIFVLNTLLTTATPSVTVEFVSKPQTTVYIGERFPSFSVILKNEYSVGVANTIVEVDLYPAQSFPIEAQDANGDHYSGRTVDCITYLLLPQASIYPVEDALLCNPRSRLQAPVVVQGAVATTNDGGVAVFTDLRLRLGFPGVYSLVVTHRAQLSQSDTSSRSIQTTIVFLSPISAMSVVSSNLPATLVPGAVITITLNLTFSLSNRSNSTSSLFSAGSTLDSTEVRTYTFAEGYDLATNVGGLLMGPAYYNAYGSEGSDSAIFENSWALVRNASGTSSSSFTGELIFNATFASASRDRIYITTFVCGRAIVLGSSEYFSLSGAPRKPLSPFYVSAAGSLSTPVIESLIPVQTVGSTPLYEVTEGSVLNISTAVTAPGSYPIRSFLSLLPVIFQQGAGSSSELKKMTGVSLFNTSDPQLRFRNVPVTILGRTGVYVLRVSCGPSWSGVFLRVLSRVRNSSILVRYSNLAPVQVGVPWKNLPSIRIVTSSGIGLSGKSVALTASGIGNVTLRYEATASDDTGAIYFTYLTVSAATALGNYTMRVAVDGVPSIQSFTFSVNQSATVDRATCAGISLEAPSLPVISGAKLSGIRFLAVDKDGAPAIGSKVSFGLASGGSPTIQLLRTGDDASVARQRSDSIMVNNSNAISLAEYSLIKVVNLTDVVGLNFYCNGDLIVSNFQIVVIARVTDIQEINVNTSSLQRSFSIGVNADVDGPVLLEMAVLQQTQWSKDYFGDVTQYISPLVSFVNLTSTSTARASLTLILTNSFPSLSGRILLSYSLDGVMGLRPIVLDLKGPTTTLSILSAPPDTATVGQPFQNQPSVLVQGPNGPLTDVVVVAEVRPATVSDFLQPFSNTSDYQVGVIGKFSDLTGSGRPLSNPSDSNGIATFQGLGFFGVSTNVTRFRIRFVATRSIEGVLSTDVEVVWDGNITIVSSTNQTCVIAVQPSAFVVAPFVSLQAACLRSALYFGYFVGWASTTGGHQEIAYSMTGYFNLTNVPITASSGTSRLSLLIPGSGTLQSNPITLLTSPLSAEVVQVPQQVRVGITFVVVVRVMSSISDGLPDALVSVSLASSNSKCTFDSCGNLDPRNTVSFTNTTGYASFQIVIIGGAASYYKLTIKVLGSSTPLINKLGGLALRSLSEETSVVVSSQQALQLVNTANLDVGSLSTDATEYAKSRVQELTDQTSQNYLYGTLIKSFLLRALTSATEVTATTSEFSLYNDVAAVEIQTEPVLGTTTSSLVTSSGYTFSTQPRIRIVDQLGQPVKGKTVKVWLSPSTRKLTYETGTVTDDLGQYQFSGLTIYDGPDGDFYVYFSVDGVLSNASQVITLQPIEVTTSTLVQTVSALLILILLPFFFSTIPHNHAVFFWVSYLPIIAIVFLSSTWFQQNVLLNNNLYLSLQLFLMISLLGTLTISQFVVTILWYIGRFKRSMRFVDEERRAMEQYSYAKWFLNVRRMKRSREEWEAIMFDEAEKKPLARLRRFVLGKVSEKVKHEEVTRRVDAVQQKFTFEAYQKEAHSLYGVEFQPPPIPLPEDLTDSSPYPTRLLLATAVSFIGVSAALFLTLWLLDRGKSSLTTLASYLPVPPSGLTDAEKSEINLEIQSGILVSLTVLADASSKFSFVTQFEATIRSIDFIGLWITLYTLVYDFKYSIEFATWFGIALASLTFLLLWFFMYLAVGPLRVMLRRGQLRFMKERAKMIKADRYIGIQAVHHIGTFFTVFGITFLIVMALSSSYIRKLLYRAFIYFLLPSLISTLITAFVENVLIGKFLVIRLTMIRLQPYFWWSAFAVILSLVNGFTKTIIRGIEILITFTVLFARLDLDLFPQAFLFLDEGYWAFYSVLFVDEEYNNPIFTTMASRLITEMLLRRCEARGETTVPIRLLLDEVRLPHIKNAVMVHLGAMTHADLSDSDSICIPDLAATPLHRRRIFARWRLAAFLALNPALRLWRKQPIMRNPSPPPQPTEPNGELEQKDPAPKPRPAVDYRLMRLESIDSPHE